MSAEHELKKRIWTEEDFDVMGWHDSVIHSLAFFPERYEFALDLDYIFQWVKPETDDGYFSFWVAPATLVFENVYDLLLDVKPELGLEIADINRGEPAKPTKADAVGRRAEWTWTIECQEGLLSFQATGYKMFVRTAPMFQSQQSLDLKLRGGISFKRGSELP